MKGRIRAFLGDLLGAAALFGGLVAACYAIQGAGLWGL